MWVSVEGSAAHVASVAKLVEELAQQRVPGRLPRDVRLDVSLCDVGRVRRLAHQHVVPGCVLRRTASGNPLVPLRATGEDRVDVDDPAAVVEEAMPDHVTHRVLRTR